jgi:hypothetical protein
MLITRDRSMLPMLGAVTHALHPSLVSPDALARVSHAMSLLPDVLTNLFYLETRLSSDPSVDIVLHVPRERRGVLLRDPAHASVRDWQGDSAAWARVRALVHAWSDERSRLATALDHIWLELDVGSGAPGAALTPGVFACFGELPRRDFTPQLWHGHALAALEPLLGGDRSPAFDWRLAECFERLPADAYVPYVGVMLGREAESMRMCLVMAAAPLLRYLDDLGWAGDSREVERLIVALTNAQPHGVLRGQFIVHIDVTKDGVWRLGVEFACERNSQHRAGVFQERALLDELVALGLASRAKCDALLLWPGARAIRVASAAEERALLRRVNHVKLVFRLDRPPEAKAYLAARYFPRLPQIGASPRRAAVAPPSEGTLLCT